MRWRFPIVAAVLVAVITGAAIAEDSAPPPPSRKLTRRTLPVYPDLARKMQMSGVVKLMATVAPNGSVKSIEVLGGSPVLIRAAEEAVMNWKFAPGAEETHELIELHFSPR